MPSIPLPSLGHYRFYHRRKALGIFIILAREPGDRTEFDPRSAEHHLPARAAGANLNLVEQFGFRYNHPTFFCDEIRGTDGFHVWADVIEQAGGFFLIHLSGYPPHHRRVYHQINEESDAQYQRRGTKQEEYGVSQPSGGFLAEEGSETESLRRGHDSNLPMRRAHEVTDGFGLVWNKITNYKIGYGVGLLYFEMDCATS